METRKQLKDAGFDFVDHGTAADIAKTRRLFEASDVEWDLREFTENIFEIETHVLAAKRITPTAKATLKAKGLRCER